MLQEEVLRNLRRIERRVKDLIEVVEKYGIDDIDVNLNLYLFARDELPELLECIFRATTNNSKLESLVTVLRKIVLPHGHVYDLHDFRIITILHNYNTMISIYAENVGTNTEFYILERDLDYEQFEKIYNQVKSIFKDSKDITNSTPPVNIA